MIKPIVVLGPTAVGKTGFAVNMAFKLKKDYGITAEIISADSRQVYKYMDIGTGKDIEEYNFNGFEVPYHLIDIKDPGYRYNLFEFRRDFFEVYKDCIERDVLPILCGGTGLYIEAVIEDYDLTEVPVNKTLRENLELKRDDELKEILSSMKKLHNSSDTVHRKRCIRAIEIEEYKRYNKLPKRDYPKFDPTIVGISGERINIRKRITARLVERLNNGMVEEAQKLLDMGLTHEDLTYYGLEYKHLSEYIKGNASFNDMKQRLNSDIHRFSKRQMTWFRRMERNGFDIFWINFEKSMKNKLKLVFDHLEKNSLNNN
ncbi:MAG: tRNA (adenosine(37)-N6)-dimethylallyltransferase MiaA [Candidatus Cloacimonadota bacterium]|nr:MAG: tRNA (adenosine(37)-N6)-dimethylallyltransferase MiaA [Candidatus Cloacimonadota bacterium]PIE78794.1 MAG: tRNA (adenosine(37)-N6)-dimethylallyltransferase MiaA [Candidatus Delongbacteria bacterium]